MTRRRDRETDLLGPGISDPLLAVAPQTNWFTRVTGDRAEHVFTDDGERRWRDPAADPFHARHISRQAPNSGGGQNRKAGYSGNHEDISRTRGPIERADVRDEIRTVGEVEIIDSQSDARLNDAIT